MLIRLKMKRFLRTIALTACIAAVACNPNTYKEINYLQDVAADTSMVMPVNTGLLIQPQDQLSIIVTAREPKLAAEFNMAVASYQAGSEIASLGGSYQRLTGYVVNNDGDINFPGLGKLHVIGLNRWELQKMVVDKLAETGLLRDALVTVEFMNFKISVLGEVARPGTYTINGDKITVFQAISLAGDLTIYGRRDCVKIIREQGGNRKVFNIDLRDTDIFNSPAYFLQQNDVVYVTPNSVRAGQSTINENYFKSGSFWMSLGSVAVTVVNLVLNIIR